ncbi:CPBP family intramembrane glutamic endopeptidase [Halalkalirubrum salinum]|uniref:CPBP family intramembrane glutamic endopeptidase n=1 Tax=Halalkalirubrum salinum TaxID=2563889 RepID=UPI0010FB96EA|nr:CPBP family intramembrane glutamic endopeptidase [Halalkalirubrum salinum]
MSGSLSVSVVCLLSFGTVIAQVVPVAAIAAVVAVLALLPTIGWLLSGVLLRQIRVNMSGSHDVRLLAYAAVLVIPAAGAWLLIPSRSWDIASPVVVLVGVCVGGCMYAADRWLWRIAAGRPSIDRVYSISEAIARLAVVPSEELLYRGLPVLIFPTVAVSDQALNFASTVGGSDPAHNLASTVAVFDPAHNLGYTGGYILLSALCFGIAHAYAGRHEVVFKTWNGCVYAIGYLLTGSIAVPIALHAGYNLASIAGVGIRRS